MVDELLRGSARNATAEHFPFMRFCYHLLLIHRYLGMARGEGEHHLVELAAGGLEVADRNSEAVDQRELFLDGFGAVHIAVLLNVASVLPGLLDKVTAV